MTADVQLYFFFNPGARKGVWSMPRSGRPTPGNEPVTFAQEAGGPRGNSGRIRKNLPPAGFEPCTVQPVEIRYTGYAIQAGKQN